MTVTVIQALILIRLIEYKESVALLAYGVSISLVLPDNNHLFSKAILIKSDLRVIIDYH